MAMAKFFIPDTAPLFAYSGSWVPAYHPRGDGFDETFHQTADGSDTVSFNLTASSLHISTPYSDSPSSTLARCDAQYRINGSDWADGCDVRHLPRGWHAVDVRPKGGGGMQFLGIRGEIRLGSDDKHHNTTIDNLSSQFTYTPSASWTLITSAGPLGAVQNQTAAGVFGDKGGFYNRSLGLSTAQDAKAEFKFKGEAVYLYGLSGPEMGVGEIMLDGRSVSTVNMSLPWRSYPSLMFMAGDLDGSVEHTVSYTNSLAGLSAVIDYAVVTLPGASSTPINLGLILGAAAGGVTFALVLCIFLYCYIIRRRSRRRATPSHRSPSHPSSAGYADTPKSIDAWRKQSGGARSPSSPISVVFSEASTAQLVKMNQPSPPDYLGIDYPDYIPYNGPVEKRPTSHNTPAPPNIVGASPSAATWLAAQSLSTSPQTGNSSSRWSQTFPSGSSSRSLTSPYASRSGSSSSGYKSTTSPVRPSPPKRQNSRDTTLSSLDVPLTALEYYSMPRSSPANIHPRDPYASPSDVPMTATDLFSVPSGRQSLQRDSPLPPSSAGSELTYARNATISMATSSRVEMGQGVARLWPSRAAVPSAMLQPDSSRGVTRLPRKLPPVSPAGSFSALYGTYTNPTQPPSALTTSQSRSTRQLPSAMPSSAALAASSPSASGPPTPSLRRGVSIKSVKTVRSFFSALISGGDMPAVPRFEREGPARPDSDLFGDSVSVSRRPSINEGSGLYGAGIGLGGNVGRGEGAGVGEGGQGGQAGYRHAPQPLRLRGSEGQGPRNLFIELNPNSPMTVVSRPGSEQPLW